MILFVEDGWVAVKTWISRVLCISYHVSHDENEARQKEEYNGDEQLFQCSPLKFDQDGVLWKLGLLVLLVNFLLYEKQDQEKDDWNDQWEVPLNVKEWLLAESFGLEADFIFSTLLIINLSSIVMVDAYNYDDLTGTHDGDAEG